MKYACRSLQAITLLAVLACCAAPLAAQQEFRWQLELGQQFSVVHRTAYRSETTYDKQSETSLSTQVYYFTWRVIEIDDEGNATIAQVLDRVVNENTYGEQEGMRYDSEQPQKKSGIYDSWQALLGETTHFDLSPRGEVSSLRYSESTRNKLVEEGMSAEISDMLWEQTVAQAIVALPAEPLQEGDSWSEERDEVGYQTYLDYTYRGQETSEETTRAVFEYVSEIELEEDPEEGDLGLEEMEFAMEGNGQVWFDTQAGYMLENRSETLMSYSYGDSGSEFSTKCEGTVELLIYRWEE